MSLEDTKEKEAFVSVFATAGENNNAVCESTKRGSTTGYGKDFVKYPCVH